MYAKLYNTLPNYHSDEILEAAISGKLRAVANIAADHACAPPCTLHCISPSTSGGEFLIRHVRVGREKRCYFAVTEDGRPTKLQRKPYTECFYTIAMAELYRTTKNQQYKVD